jgi:hypothetical protein
MRRFIWCAFNDGILDGTLILTGLFFCVVGLLSMISSVFYFINANIEALNICIMIMSISAIIISGITVFYMATR